MRERIVSEALSFIGTKYHKGGMLKGIGVDCGTLLLLVLRDCGLIEPEEVGVYGHDWWRHTSEEKYMLRMLRHGHKVLEGISWSSLETLPGNIALTKAANSKVYNHGGIVVKWPIVIHAAQQGVCETDASKDVLWAGHDVVIFDVVAHRLSRDAEEVI